MTMPPSPHKRITYLKPLPDHLYNQLLHIYKSAETYIMKFNIPNEFICDMVWPETEAELEWIKKEILSFYGVAEDDVKDIQYTTDPDKADLFSGTIPDYVPKSLNFTKFTHGSITEIHHAWDNIECKINIPILNMGQACIHFFDTSERCWYPTTALLNIAYDHDVEGLENLKINNLEERVFFQIVLKGTYKHYSETLERPNGW
jgi:hypothetical protein